MDSIFRTTVLPAFPGVIILAYHTPFVEPFNDYQGSCVYNNQYPYIPDTSAYPNGLGYAVDTTNIFDSVANLYHLQTPIDIEMNAKSWDPEKRIVNLELNMTNDGEEDMEGTYRYNIVVTEDSLIQPHMALYGCSTPDDDLGKYDNNYVNSWVTRKLVYCSEGELLIKDAWPASQTIKRYASFTLHPSWLAENCNITVYIFKRKMSSYPPPPPLYRCPTMQALQEPIIGWTAIPEKPKPSEKGILGIIPNPAKDFVNIHVSIANKGSCSLDIYNINGQHIKTLHRGNRSPGLYNVEFKTNSIPSGTYIVVLETSTGRTSEKLVIR